MRLFAFRKLWFYGLLCGALVNGSSLFAASEESIANGRALYQRTCFLCHQLNGQGLPRVYPPLANSDFLLSDPRRAARILCEGLSGEIIVNWKKFDGVMPPVTLNDQEVADVLKAVGATKAKPSPPIL